MALPKIRENPDSLWFTSSSLEFGQTFFIFLFFIFMGKRQKRKSQANRIYHSTYGEIYHSTEFHTLARSKAKEQALTEAFPQRLDYCQSQSPFVAETASHYH